MDLFIQTSYLVAAGLFILSLKWMSAPATARRGVLAGEMEDKDEARRALSGIIALQYHDPGLNFEVRYKDIRIKLLPETK